MRIAVTNILISVLPIRSCIATRIAEVLHNNKRLEPDWLHVQGVSVDEQTG